MASPLFSERIRLIIYVVEYHCLDTLKDFIEKYLPGLELQAIVFLSLHAPTEITIKSFS